MTEARSLWGLRCLALALAGLAWFSFSGEKREPLSEKVVEASVRYDAPDNFLILERVETVRVSARGPLSKIRNLTAPFVDVFVDLPDQVGVQQVTLGEDQVILPEGLELVSVEPNVIEVTLDSHATRFVLIEAEFTGEPAAGARVLSSRVIPNQALRLCMVASGRLFKSSRRTPTVSRIRNAIWSMSNSIVRIRCTVLL